MLTFNLRVFREFERLSDERLNQLGETVLTGSVPSHEVYKQITGQLQGLREAKELLLEAISIAEGRPGVEESRGQDAIYGNDA